ncbi:DMT family transporter [Xenorhabdus budapestensis]|uniref:DMT family transporter n=1 Tax=Xenorhabdus budapestensis TaxID=290110 RepID=UPI001FD20CAB|nr:EamA family transporter [Xenorhabdus budapestensis]
MNIRITPQIAVVLTLIATFLWGSNFQVTKIALVDLPPWTASGERFVFAVLCIFIFMMFRRKINGRAFKKNWLAFICLGGIGISGFNGALFVGLQHGHPVTAALIMATTPVSANILEAIINRRFPEIIRTIGMIISLLGVALVITNGQLIFGSTVHIEKGVLIIFAGSLSWAIYTVGIRVFVTEATPLETTSWTMFFGMIILVIVTIVVESPVPALLSAPLESHLASIYMGIAGSFLAYLFWNIGITIRGAGKTAIFFNFVPVFALIIQIIVENRFNLIQFIGGTLTIIGVLLGQGTSKMFRRTLP